MNLFSYFYGIFICFIETTTLSFNLFFVVEASILISFKFLLNNSNIFVGKKINTKH